VFPVLLSVGHTGQTYRPVQVSVTGIMVLMNPHSAMNPHRNNQTGSLTDGSVYMQEHVETVIHSSNMEEYNGDRARVPLAFRQDADVCAPVINSCTGK